MPDVSVVSTAHDLADARLHRLCAALAAAGLDVEVRALGSAERGPAGARVHALGRRGGLLRRVVRALTLPFRARGRVLVTVDPDLAPAAVARRRLRSRPWVADVHEDYVALLDDRAWARGITGRVARRLAGAATRATAGADLTLVADDHLRPTAARQRLVVRNLPDLPAVPGPRGDAPRLVYVGDVRRSRGLAWMLDAVEAADPWELDVVGPVAPADAAWLDERLGAWRGEPRVRLHGRLPPGPSWQVASGAWAAACLLEDTPAFRAAVPTKLYEYLGHGLAVLASPLPRVAPLVEAAGAGRVVRDPAEASATLRGWYDDPRSLDVCRASARRWAEHNLAGPSPFELAAIRVRELT